MKKPDHDLFKNVISSNGTYFKFYKEFGVIRLNGIFCSDELREIAKVIDTINRNNIKNKNL